MPDYRIPWQKTDAPQRFTASVPDGGTAEMWYQKTGPQGTAGWRWRIVIGATRESGTGNDKQHCSDQANRFLPEILKHEQARVAKIEAKAALHRQIEAAHEAGTVDVVAFNLRAASDADLIEILEFIRRRGWLDGCLKPLREAASNEAYRRRIEGR